MPSHTASRVSDTALKLTFWASATGATILGAMVAGTEVGDHMVIKMNGATVEQTQEIVAEKFPDNPELWQGMVAEKRRSFENASQAHTFLQRIGYTGLAITLPLAIGTFMVRRSRKAENGWQAPPPSAPPPNLQP